MKDSHVLTRADNWFLKQNLKDPVTLSPFEQGDTIVICAACKAVQYKASWEMNRNRCTEMGCKHPETLKFSAFSPTILRQTQSSHTVGFKIKRQKVQRKGFLDFDVNRGLYVVAAIVVMVTAIIVYGYAKYNFVSLYEVKSRLAAIVEEDVYAVGEVITLSSSVANNINLSEKGNELISAVSEKIEMIDKTQEVSSAAEHIDKASRNLVDFVKQIVAI